MSLELVNSIEDFYNLKEFWNKLLDKSDSNTLFLRHEFLYAWWQCFNKNKQLAILISKIDNELIGIAPLYKKNNTLFFIGQPHSDYSDFICPLEDKPKFIKEILSYIDNNSIKNMVLEQLPGNSASLKILKDLQFSAYIQVKCPTMIIKGHEEDIRKNQLRKKSLRRHFNYFNREGTLAIEHYSKFTEIEPYLDDFFKQHISRWQHTNTPSLFQKEKNKLFYRNLISEFSGTEKVLFSIVRWNNNILGYHLGFEHNNIFTWYKPTYDIKLQNKSPGEVLLKYLLEYAVENKRDEFDFTRGIEGFKLRFANKIRDNYIVFWKKDINYYKFLTVKFLKNHPKLEKIVRKIIKN